MTARERRRLPRGEASDVTLVLEGTYPYVSGGVSSWVSQIVRAMQDLRFGIVFIGGDRERYDGLRFELPDNVVHFEEHYLSDAVGTRGVVARRGDAELYRASSELHDAFRQQRGLADLDRMLDRLASRLLADPAKHELDFLFSERSWDEIARRYESGGCDRPFVEYFWTVRSMHAPLFALARAVPQVPPARAYHVVSTGFAGCMAALLAKARARPLVLTEHGIYTKERRIELLQASWIQDDEPDVEPSASIGFIRQLWIRFFEAIGRMTYAASDPVVTLFEGNRERQIQDGAAPERTRVIPNGIDVRRFAPLRARRTEEVPPVLALVGRVVPIKDVKTFVRAARIVCTEMPEAEAWIVGPEDEDPGYALECRDLVRSLGLEGKVKLLGHQRVEDVYPRIGLNVLTSVSEAQPLVVLEGFAAGVPCVASDVGSCRELVEGARDDDRALGSAGEIVGIADPAATARAALSILRDRARWRAAQRAGIERVERNYTQERMVDRYRAIYAESVVRTG